MSLKKFILCCAILAFVISIQAQKVRHFNRHFIILVDQTKIDQSDKLRIYEGLKCWLNGDNEGANRYIDQSQSSELPQLIPFDPEHDQMSLFAFGLVGRGIYSRDDYGKKNILRQTDYQNIHSWACSHSKTPAEVYKSIYTSLIHSRDDFHGQGKSCSDFFSDCVLNLFNNKDVLYNEINEKGGITLSHYVYPLILNYINTDIPTAEYIILIVSDFKSGLVSKGDAEDRARINELMGNGTNEKSPQNPQYVNYFYKQINLLGDPFQQVDYCKMVSGEVQLNVSRLVVKEALNNPPLFITSNVTMKQTRNHNYQLAEATINFNLDNSTTVDSVEVLLNDANGAILNSIVLNDHQWKYDSQKRVFVVEALSFPLSNNVFRNCPLDVIYNFYTTSSAGERKLLPFMMSAHRQIQRSEITFIDNNKQRNMNTLWITLAAIAALACLIILGRKKKVTIQAEDFLEEYVNVTPEKGAVRQSCLFYSPGSGNAPSPIPVKGTIKSPLFSIPWKTSLYAFIDDSEITVDGVHYCINNDSDNIGKWVPIELKGKSYKFNIYPLIDPKLDLSKVLDIKIDIKLAVVPSFLGIGKLRDMDQDKIMEHYKEENHSIFRHYLIEDIGHSWIGIDPGTTGSCVAISGDPQANVTDININLMEVKDGNEFKNIIPSKLVLHKSSIADKKSVADMTPGIDYLYGIKADGEWDKHHKNRYQSIKKLLGYKKKEGDLIKAEFENDKSSEFTGVELAHLLIRGLQKDLDSYISNMSPEQKRKLMPDGKKPRRAVVAIPNNYTLNRTLDMVDSIRMLGQYQEVRFIYEAEGVLFNYLQKTYGEKMSGSENIMIFDMGGATINCSVFQVKYMLDDEHNIRFKVKTIARVGYGIGGDTIDVALLETLLTMPELGNISLRTNTQERHEYEAKHKSVFLRNIFNLKIDIIRRINHSGKYSIIQQEDNFDNYVNKFLKDLHKELQSGTFDTEREKQLREEAHSKSVKERDLILRELNEKFASRTSKRFTNESAELKHFVYDNIADAVREAIGFKEVSSLDKIIFSGRSTTFPYVRKTVTETILNESGFSDKNHPLIEWKGLDENELKSAVASGACWYGQCGMVELDNSLINGSYGFKHTAEGKASFHPLLNSNLRFNGEQPLNNEEEFVSSFAGDGHNICFYQIMGSGQDSDIFNPENRHKINYLGAIHATNKTENVSVSIDRRNLAVCKVTFESGHEMELSTVAAEHDLSHEQDWPYVFATLNLDEDND